MTKEQISRGLRALDAVKHCQDKMSDEEYLHDSEMRETPPNRWRFADVIKQEETAKRING